MSAKIIVTGGAGRLARALFAIDHTLDTPTRQDMDFSIYESIQSYCMKRPPDILIHAGGTTNKFHEDVDEGYIRNNIIGTANVVLWCMRNNIRLVYISSDYVYPGERGNYSEESVLYPVNRYARSKLGGEMAVQLYENSLIIRTSFYEKLDFEKACIDQYTSRIPIKEAAHAVYQLALRTDMRGIVNVGLHAKRSVTIL